MSYSDLNFSELGNGYVYNSSVLYLDGAFCENVDGMLVPITESTARAILNAVDYQKDDSSPDGSAI
jgi:hypothetical protein